MKTGEGRRTRRIKRDAVSSNKCPMDKFIERENNSFLRERERKRVSQARASCRNDAGSFMFYPNLIHKRRMLSCTFYFCLSDQGTVFFNVSDCASTLPLPPGCPPERGGGGAQFLNFFDQKFLYTVYGPGQAPW
jgi:hypothetical protein